MRIPGWSGVLMLALAIAACGKKAADIAAAETAVSATPAAEPASAATPVAQAAAADTTELARKQALLAYSIMEDSYIGDASGQWASAVRVSTTFGEEQGASIDSTNSNSSYGVRGAPDSRSWSNNNQTLGIDWLEATFARPVSATEVRIVSTKSPQAIAKIELIDVGGTSHTVWSGVNEDPDEIRGPRTWVVRKFAATPYQVKAVKVTIANALVSNYKEIDAVQLIGK